MGLFFRKSVGIGPFRVNLSKSGVSYSVGVKGARVNFGNRGTYVNVGSNGVYYRKKISTNIENQPNSTPNLQPKATYDLHTITSGDLDGITDVDSMDFINELTEKYNKISYLNWYGILPLVFLAVSLLIGFFLPDEVSNTTKYDKNKTLFWILFTTVAIVFSFLMPYLSRRDKERLLIEINYDIDESIKNIYDKFILHFSDLLNCSRVWQYLHVQSTNDYKYNSGASAIVNRKPLDRISKNKKPTPLFLTNIEIPYLGLINTELFFFPERLIIKRGNKFAAIMYKNIEICSETSRFIETEGVAYDAQVVGSTWRYLNKNGTPDKRFNNNHQIPICNYSKYLFFSKTGLQEEISTSKLYCFDSFVKYIGAIGQLQNNMSNFQIKNSIQ